jgi:hypothetical protein
MRLAGREDPYGATLYPAASPPSEHAMMARLKASVCCGASTRREYPVEQQRPLARVGQRMQWLATDRRDHPRKLEFPVRHLVKRRDRPAGRNNS